MAHVTDKKNYNLTCSISLHKHHPTHILTLGKDLKHSVVVSTTAPTDPAQLIAYLLLPVGTNILLRQRAALPAARH